MTRETRRRLFQQVDIYPVTCEEFSQGRSNLEVLEAVIQGGARIIQLREKEYPKKDLYHLALKFREMTAKAGVLLIINDHVDIALAVHSSNASSIRIYFGQGNGTFPTSAKIAQGLGCLALAQADMNGDGFTDLVAASGSGDNMYFLPSNGDGTFKKEIAFAGGGGPRACPSAPARSGRARAGNRPPPARATPASSTSSAAAASASQ